MQHSRVRGSRHAGLGFALILLLPSCTEIAYGSGGAGTTASGGSAPVGGSGATGSGASDAGGGIGGAGGTGAGGSVNTGGGGGCDADIKGDPANCGACGHDCAGGECSEGVCQPVELWASSADEGARFSYGVTIAEDKVVWVCDQGTLSLPITAPPGSSPFLVSTTPGVRILYDAPLVYRSWGTLITSPLTGGSDGTWGSGQCNRDLARDTSGNTFCVEDTAFNGRLFRYDASFQAVEMLGDLSAPFGVVVSDEDVYIGTQAGLLRLPKNSVGVVPENLLETPVPSQLVQKGPHLYFGTSSLLRLTMSNENVMSVVPDVAPGSIHVDDSHIYFSVWESPVLWRVDLDGGDPYTWGVEPPYADVIAGTDDFLFFTSDADGRLFRLRK